MRTESSYADLKSGLTKLLLYLFWQQIRALHSFTPQGQKRTVINSAEPLCRHHGSPPVQTPRSHIKEVAPPDDFKYIFFSINAFSVPHVYIHHTSSTHAACRQERHSWRHSTHSFGWKDFKGSVRTQRITLTLQWQSALFVCVPLTGANTSFTRAFVRLRCWFQTKMIWR